MPYYRFLLQIKSKRIRRVNSKLHTPGIHKLFDILEQVIKSGLLLRLKLFRHIFVTEGAHGKKLLPPFLVKSNLYSHYH